MGVRKRIPILFGLLFGVFLVLNFVFINSYSETSLNQSDSLINEQMIQKFDKGFDKKIENLIKSGESRDYNVIILVKKETEILNEFEFNPALSPMSSKFVAQKYKDNLENVLINTHGVTQFYKAQILSFITANVPLSEIPKIAEYDYVVGIGDGERKVFPLSANMDDAKFNINAENLAFNGSGVNVAVIDTGIRQDHLDLPLGTKIVMQARCIGSCDPNGNVTDPNNHGTHQAGIIAGLGIIDPQMKGVAPGANLFNIKAVQLESSIANSLDYVLVNGANVANISLSRGDSCNDIDMLDLIISEAVDEGLVVVTGAGNFGPQASTIDGMSCNYNTISVGAIDDKNTRDINDDTIWDDSSTGGDASSLGPTFDGRLKPEILAPGKSINSTDLFVDYAPVTGTSHSAPFVSGASAIILEAKPEFTPLEVKASLLLGANWTGNPVPLTAADYEANPLLFNSTLNQRGFGLLDVSQSLTYALGTNILRGTVDEFESRDYSFSANQDEQVKVILSWLKHPGGSILVPQNVTISNLDFVIKQPDGSNVTSNSLLQNNEFAVFDANMTGAYTITISAPLVSPAASFSETFALASTHSLQVGTFFVKEGTFVKALPGTIAQLSRPTADISVGGWTTTPLYQKLDEATPDDSDFVTSPTGTSPEFEVGLTNVVDPLSNTDHIIKFRAFASDGGGAKEKANAVLLEGANEIAETGLQNLDRSQFTQFEYTLSSAEADDITDYTNLSIRIETSKSNSEEIQVSWIEFEVPSQPSQQSINVGFKPKALILFTTGQTAEGSTDGYKFSMGYSNGTDSRSIGVASDDDAAKANAGRIFGTKVLGILASGTPTDVSAEADLVGFGINNFTIKWTTNDSIQSNIHYIALGGDDLIDTKVSSFAAQTTTGNQNVTVGFKPDFLMFMHAASTTETSSATNGYISYGFAKSPTQRGAIAVTSEDGRAAMDTWNYQRADRSIVMINDRTGVIDAEANFVSMNTDGFTINWIDAPSDSDRIYYLALKGGSYEVGNFNKSTSPSPTTQTITSLGIVPKALILSSVNDVTATVVQSNNRLSFGASDGVSESAVWVGDQDAASDSITARSNTATKIIRLATEAATGSSSTINAEADLQSFNSNGFNLNWTTNDSEATQILYVAFGNFDLASGLVGYWKLDENAGLLATDTSGKNNTGTLINGTTWVSGSSCIDNSCLSFDGINDHVSVPDSDTLEGMTELTVSAWVKRDVLANATDWVIGKSTEPNTFNSGSYDIRVASNEGTSGVRMIIFIQDLVRCSTSIQYPHDTNFHHVLLWYKSGTPMLMYIDGVSTVSGCNFSGPINNSTYPVTFASHDNPPDPRYLQGVIDDVRIYERALIDAEIQELFQMGT